MADWMDENGISFNELSNFSKNKNSPDNEDKDNDLIKTMKKLETD